MPCKKECPSEKICTVVSWIASSEEDYTILPVKGGHAYSSSWRPKEITVFRAKNKQTILNLAPMKEFSTAPNVSRWS